MDTTHRLAWRALFVATIAFAANFSIWTLYAVLAIDIQTKLSLSALELGVLLSSPIVSGALLRIPLGIISERVSPRRLWIILMWLQLPPLIILPYIESFWVMFGSACGLVLAAAHLPWACVMSRIGLGVLVKGLLWVCLVSVMLARQFPLSLFLCLRQNSVGSGPDRCML